jgi:predicted nucleic acid-binding protein
MTRVAYVDSSALAKLLILEAESPALTRWYVEVERAASSRIGIIETRRAVARRAGVLDPITVDKALSTIEIVELDRQIAERAASIGPASLRTLDAIHIATALQLGALDAFVTYDDRLAEAARLLGLPVIRPA